MYQIMVKLDFAAAHALRGYEGVCAQVHGHNWEVTLCLKGETLNELGILADFKVVKADLKTITDRLDHQHLNDLPAFADANPSCENVAMYIKNEYTKLCPPSCEVAWLEVWETHALA